MHDYYDSHALPAAVAPPRGASTEQIAGCDRHPQHDVETWKDIEVRAECLETPRELGLLVCCTGFDGRSTAALVAKTLKSRRLQRRKPLTSRSRTQSPRSVHNPSIAAYPSKSWHSLHILSHHWSRPNTSFAACWEPIECWHSDRTRSAVSCGWDDGQWTC